jgi:hypothetical protein
MADARILALKLLEGTEAMSRYERDRRIKWAFPQLTLRVYADSVGVHVYAIVETLSAKGVPQRDEIANVVWAPEEVTERSVVDWAHRALERWIATQVPPS